MMHSTDSQDRSKKFEPSAPPHVSGNLSFVPDSTDGLKPNLTGIFAPGEIVGGSYEVVELLGRGAMGIVYKARHTSMQSEYALKVLTGEQLNQSAVLRFQNEAQALAKLNHPNLISIFNFGLHNGELPYYVMELLGGENMLDKLDAHGPMPVKVAMSYFIEVCSGLGYAHRKGILHRDIKPANFVLLNEADVRGARVKVVDFGIVKFAEELKPDAQKLTAIGDVCGSPSYMSPEQSSGLKVDPRADIYSLGCSLYQALTGKLPFMGRNATETMMMHHSDAPPSLASKANGVIFSDDVERLVAKMLAKMPMDRYQNMDAVAQDLKNILENRPLGAMLFRPPVARSSSSTEEVSVSYSDLESDGPESFGIGTNNSAVQDRFELPASARSVAMPKDQNRSEHSLENFNLFQINRSGSPVTSARLSSTISRKFLVGVLIVGGVALAAAALALVYRPPELTSKSKTFTSAVAAKSVSPLPISTDLSAHKNEVSQNDGIGEGIQLSSSQYFSKKVVVDGLPCIQFDFPEGAEDLPIGWLSPESGGGRPMVSKIIFPVTTRLYVSPVDGSSLARSKFCEKFRPGEITGIFMDAKVATDELLSVAVNIKGVSVLIIHDCAKLTKKIIPSLNKLKLKALNADNINIDGAELAKATIWPSLQRVFLGNGKNVSPILVKLQGSRNLERLSLPHTHLTGSDYKMISECSELQFLDLKGSDLTEADLKTLAKLKKLAVINVAYVRLSSKSLAEGLRHFSGLKRVFVRAGAFNPQDLQSLQATSPKLVVRACQ